MSSPGAGAPASPSDRGGRGAQIGAVELEDRQVPVGSHRVPAAVARVVPGGEALQHRRADRGDRVADRRQDVIALGVGVGVDLVGDLSGEQRQADGAVVGAGREPVDARAAGQQPAPGGRPEPDVVAPGGAPRDLLLVGEGLGAAEEHEGAHRRGPVGAPGQRRAHDAHRAAQAQGVGERPARRLHDPVQVLSGSAHGQVDRVPEHAVGGAGAPDEVVGHVDRREDAVHPGQGQVGRQQPEPQEVGQLRGRPPALAGQREREQGHVHQRDAEEDQVQTVPAQQAPPHGARGRVRVRAPPRVVGRAAGGHAPHPTRPPAVRPAGRRRDRDSPVPSLIFQVKGAVP